MAKGKGTVGRKGRERPEIGTGGQGGFIFTGGGGGGVTRTSTGRIPSIPKKRQPRPDLTWNDPDDTTLLEVSKRTKYPEQGPHAENYKKSFTNIDKVHRIPANVNPVQVRSQSRPGSNTYGVHYFHEFLDRDPDDLRKPPEKREFSDIEVNTGVNPTGKKELKDASERHTTYHEYGHFYDSQSNKENVLIPNERKNKNFHKRRFDAENAFEAVRQQGTTEPREGDSPMVQWAKSIQRTKTYKRLKKNEERATDYSTKSHLEYLTRPRELFARSYAQYIGEKADPQSMRARRAQYERMDPQDKKDIGYSHWRGKDFTDTKSAFDNLFKSRGEAVGKRSTPGGGTQVVTVGRIPSSVQPSKVPESRAQAEPYPTPTTRSLNDV